MSILAVICPVSIKNDANQLAATLGLSMSELETFTAPTYEDADGDAYCISFGGVSSTFKLAVQQPLVRPEYDTEEVIDLAAASNAQSLLDDQITDIKTKLSYRYVDTNQQAHAFLVEAGLTKIPLDI